MGGFGTWYLFKPVPEEGIPDAGLSQSSTLSGEVESFSAIARLILSSCSALRSEAP